MSETISRPFTFVKDGVFYFSRRIPNELKCHYRSPRIAFSLRTKSARIAEARARKAADQLDEYWYHLRCQDAKLPGKHMLREDGSVQPRLQLPVLRPSCRPHLFCCRRPCAYTCIRRARVAL